MCKIEPPEPPRTSMVLGFYVINLNTYTAMFIILPVSKVHNLIACFNIGADFANIWNWIHKREFLWLSWNLLDSTFSLCNTSQNHLEIKKTECILELAVLFLVWLYRQEWGKEHLHCKLTSPDPDSRVG